MANVALGDLPTGWNGPNNAVVNNVGGSKCVTNNTDRTPAELTLTDLFNQPGDFVLNFTCIGMSNVSGSMKQTGGKIMDENGNTISFQLSPNYGHLSFGDSPLKKYRANGNNAVYSSTYTITRRGNILSMTCEGLEGEVITMRSDTFKSLTGFFFTIPSTYGGISQFSVRQLNDSEAANDGASRNMENRQSNSTNGKTKIRVRGMNAVEVLANSQDGKTLGRLETLTRLPDFSDKYTIVP